MNFNLKNKTLILVNMVVITIFCTIILFVYTSIKKTSSEQIQQKVNNELLYVETSILETLMQSIEELKAISTILIFKPDTSLSEFQEYAKNQIRLKNDDLIIEWQPIIKHKDRENFEKRAKEQGMTNFYLWEPGQNGKAIPATIKEEYVPVYYMLSNYVDINTLGIDLAWSPERMASKYLARDLGYAQASDFFKVITGKTKEYNPIGFAITYPVYDGGLIPNSIEKRKDHIIGYLAGVYSISALFDKLLKETNNKKMVLSITSMGNKELPYTQNHWTKSPYSKSITINVYGTQWNITLSASETYIEENFSKNQTYLLIVQFILGLVIISILNILYLKNYQLREHEKQIEDERNRSQHYLDIAGSMIIALDKHGIITLVNQDSCRILEAKEKDLIGKNWFDNFLVTDEIDSVKDVFSQIIAGKLKNVRYHENYIRTTRGEKRLIAWKNSLIYEGTKVIGILSSGSDITEHRKNENKIIEQKKEFESIFNYAKDGIAIVNLEGDFLKANQAFLDITGYEGEEILLKNCNELTTEEYKEINQKALINTIEHGSTLNIEKACTKKDNTHIDVIMNMSLLPDNNSILLVIHDTTAIKLMQEQSKLASLGEMIGNIAHQWRQPLSLISTGASALKLKADLDNEVTISDVTHYSNLIIQQSEYLSNTIDNFRDFVRSDLSYRDISLNKSIQKSLNLVEASFQQNFITLNTNLDEDIPIYGNSNELSQAFINILNNSKDALRDRDQNERLVVVSTTKINSNKIQISFKDTGGGIDISIQDKIFEPYFTTKHSYTGTGLGLSMVYKIIVQRHHGTIEVENIALEHKGKKFKGVEFKITFEKKQA